MFLPMYVCCTSFKKEKTVSIIETVFIHMFSVKLLFVFIDFYLVFHPIKYFIMRIHGSVFVIIPQATCNHKVCTISVARNRYVVNPALP